MSDKKETYSVLEYVKLMGGYSEPPSPTNLGKQIAKAYREAGLGEPKTDYRMVKGRQTLVKVYESPNAVVDAAIEKYYEAYPDLCPSEVEEEQFEEE